MYKRKGDVMKRNIYLLLGFLLIVSGASAAGQPAPTEAQEPLQVRTIIKTHDTGYGVKHAPGPSDLLKTPKAERQNAPYLKPKVIQVPKQEVSDAE
jgi:hypothetical protein